MRRAARRGVDVRLILQGTPDMPIAKMAATMLYEHLQRDGVRVYEYLERPLHGKVAVVDDEWCTVGSSNLDPLSLALNLEANVVLRSAGFAAQLRGTLERLIATRCAEVPVTPGRGWGLWQQLRSLVVFHVLRNFALWASWLPRHAPRLTVHPPPDPPVHEPPGRPQGELRRPTGRSLPDDPATGVAQAVTESPHWH
jgi:cardiolipin synthase